MLKNVLFISLCVLTLAACRVRNGTATSFYKGQSYLGGGDLVNMPLNDSNYFMFHCFSMTKAWNKKGKGKLHVLEVFNVQICTENGDVVVNKKNVGSSYSVKLPSKKYVITVSAYGHITYQLNLSNNGIKNKLFSMDIYLLQGRGRSKWVI